MPITTNSSTSVKPQALGRGYGFESRMMFNQDGRPLLPSVRPSRPRDILPDKTKTPGHPKAAGSQLSKCSEAKGSAFLLFVGLFIGMDRLDRDHVILHFAFNDDGRGALILFEIFHRLLV